MALWKTAYGRYVELHVTATESAVNITNNTSKVNVKIQLYYGGGTSTFNNNPQTLTVKVDGTTIRSQTGIKYSLSTSNRTLTIGEWSKTVTHNGDGSKTSSISVNIKDNSGQGATINNNLVLETIPRASNLKLSSTTIPLGQTATLTINRAHYTFTHDVRYDFQGLTGQTTGISTANGAGTSVTFTPPASLASRIPNATSGKGNIIVTTKNGSTVVGTTSISFTLTIPGGSTYEPSVSGISVSEQNATVKSLGVWVQGHSRIRISATVSGRYSATIRSARVYIGGIWHNAKISGSTATIENDYSPNVDGSHNYTLEATDSRGRKNSISGTINVEKYSKPRMIVSANRNPSLATTIDISAKVTGTSLSGKNVLTMQTYIKASTDSSWGTPKKSTPTSTNGTLDFGKASYGGYLETISYEVRIISKDSLSSWSEAIIPIATTAVLMDAFKDKGVSFGAYYDELLGGEVQLNGTAYLNGSPMYSSGDFTYGSNENGEYYRFPDGTQICTIGELTVTYSHAVRLQATWTYPIVFKGSAVAIANRQGYHGGTDGVLRGIPTADGAERTCVVRLWTASSNYGKDDTASMRVIAIGRWK